MIHEEAMRHFLDPGKRGSKFEYTLPRPLPKPIPPVIPHHLSKPKTPVVTFAGRNMRQEVRAIVFTLYSWELTGRSRFYALGLYNLVRSIGWDYNERRLNNGRKSFEDEGRKSLLEGCSC